MNLNISQWKTFTIKKLFPKLVVGSANQGMLSEGSDCFYVGAKRNDNGVMLHCQRDEDLILKGNCIIFICNGEGSVGYANYMDRDFFGTTDIVAGYNENLNYLNGVFLATVISKERPKYSFGRKWKTHLKDTEIKLPIQHNIDGSVLIDDTHEYSDEGYIPDWKFMEDYIKGLHCKPITTKNEKHLLTGIYTQKWKEFKISNLFDVVLSKGDIKIDDVEQGNIPLVSSGETNNGIVGYISNDGDGKAEIFDGNLITVDMFCNAFYQKEPFYAVSHGRVNILLPKFKLTSYIAMFICALIKQEQYKFSYGRAVYSTVCEDIEIKLPAILNPQTNKYEPDWQFMENYIKSLPYGDRI